MKRLIVMRHAKSAWDTDAPTDHDRPLNKRGRRDAPRVGTALAARGWVPELVLSSDSARTRETWAGVHSTLGAEPEVVFTPALYHEGMGAVQRLIAGVPDAVGTVLVLGHNPGWEDVVGWLSGRWVTMKTASTALLRAQGPWEHVATRAGGMELVELIRAREL